VTPAGEVTTPTAKMPATAGFVWQSYKGKESRNVTVNMNVAVIKKTFGCRERSPSGSGFC
jgi:hypothetical protein